MKKCPQCKKARAIAKDSKVCPACVRKNMRLIEKILGKARRQ